MKLYIAGSEDVVWHVIRHWGSQHRFVNATAIKLTSRVRFVHACSLMAPARGVYIVPRLLACKGYFIGGETNDLAILLVELPFAIDESPCQEIEHERQPRRGPKFRPWKL